MVEVSARQPHPSEPGEPRLAAPISRRLPLARAGRAQDLPASLPCSVSRRPSTHSRQSFSRLPCLITTHHPHRKRTIGVAQPGRAISPSSDPASHAHDPSRAHCRRIGPCLRSCHGAAGSPRAIFVAVDGDASFGRLVVESFCWKPAESRTPCSNEPRSRRPLRNVQTQWDEGALSNPGAGTGNWKAGRNRTRKKRRKGEPQKGKYEGS